MRIAHAVLPTTTIVLFALPALSPVLNDWFTCGYDNSFHLWRAVEVHNLLRQGVWLARWAADMAHGYGFLLFNFVSPLSAYVAAGLRFAGLSWVRAVNGTFALGLLLSGLTVYLFVRDHFGHRAGLVSAVAYMYAPFQAYDAFYRGGMSQAFAWWLPPLVLWSLSRWHSRRGGVGMLVVTATSFAALILTHNVFAFLFGPLLIGFLVLPKSDEAQPSEQLKPGGLARGALPLVLGLGLSTFFWLPGLAERDWVQTQRLLGVWVFDYRNNFLNLWDLLALPRVTDPTLVNDWPPRALGLVPATIAVLPLWGWRRLSQVQRGIVVLFLGSMVVFGLMTLPIARPLWDHLPLLPYVQFPWRFLGPTAFCAAVLAGAVVPALADRSQRATWIGIILIAVLFIANQGWFFPDHCPPPGDTSVAGMIRWEQGTDTLGATAGGEYLPIWVKRMPSHPQLLADYDGGGPIRRLDTATLPPGTEITRADYGPLDAEIELWTPETFQARYLAFYYPGWRASLDDQAVVVTPSDPDGLITFNVPAGRHVIRVRFGSTGLRTAATALSVAALLGLSIAVIVLYRQKNRQVERLANVATDKLACLIFPCLALVLVASRFLIEQNNTPLRRSRLDGGRLPTLAQPYAINFGQRWLFLGHDRLPETIASGDALEVVLYWRALNPQGRDYAASLAVVDTHGQRWTEIGMRSPRWHRTPPPVHSWPADGYALTAYLADLLPGAPPGDYRLILTSFDKADPLTPLTAFAPDGVALGPSLDLGGLRVERPSSFPSSEEVAMHKRLGAKMGPLILAGVDLDRSEATPGDPMLVSLFWQVGDDGPTPIPDLTAHLALVGTDGVEATAWELPPVRADWPTTRWAPGDLWRGQHQLRLPGGLESGDYLWHLQLYAPSDPSSHLSQHPKVQSVAEGVELGRLRVNAPQRSWQAPPLQLSLYTDLGESVTLLGANLLGADLAPIDPVSKVQSVAADTSVQPATTLTVTLAWQARAEMAISYRVFLHLLGPDGDLLTQSDGEPAGWTRPTTGWAPGEVVLDERELEIPADAAPGRYRLVAGLYDAHSGERLPLLDGSTTIPITPLTIELP